MKKISLGKQLQSKAFFILTVAVALSCLVFCPLQAFANNLIIDNFSVHSTDASANTIVYSCDISWENSWRNTINYDALWVFLKYSTDAGISWSHASMGVSGINPQGFNAPVNFEIIVPQDEKGFFLQRTDLSSGNVTVEGVRFVWDYGQDGLSDEAAMAANTINRIFGVEVVYVPEGAFYAGDGNGSSGFRFKQGSADNDPWYIQSEGAITTTSGTSDGFYYQNTGTSGEHNNGGIFLIPDSFPKGYQAFYQMKYELTEGQWVSFFNTLSIAQKINRDITGAVEGGKNSDAVIFRNTVSWDSSNTVSNAQTSRKDRPVSYISWPDMLAYADWAALRPMTELEFEKAARGKDITPAINEYVWGKPSLPDYAMHNEIYPDADEDGTEQVFDGSANINSNGVTWASGDGRVGGDAEGQQGPLRAGIFAESSTNRTTSGASYYGAMEMSGNLCEMIVTVGKTDGYHFLGTHGDGELSSISGYEGNATNIDWPGINSSDFARGVTGTSGSGYRGGDFLEADNNYFQISNRLYAVKDSDSAGYSQRYDSSFGVFQGGRLVRTAL